MAISAKYGITLLEGSQSQKYISVNEAIRYLDALTQIRVLDRDLTAPPGSPSDGDIYIPAATATGDWTGGENDLALFLLDHWVVIPPVSGWQVWIEDEGVWLYWNGSAWTALPISYTPPAYSWTSLTLSSGAHTSNTNKLASWAESVDTDNYFDAGNPTRISAPFTGVYRLNFNLMWSLANGSFLFQVWVALNRAGSTAFNNDFPMFRCDGTHVTGNISRHVRASGLIQLTAGDYIEIVTYQFGVNRSHDTGGRLQMEFVQ